MTALGLRASPRNGLCLRADPVPVEGVLGGSRLSQTRTIPRKLPSIHHFTDHQKTIRLSLSKTHRPEIGPMLRLHILLTCDIGLATLGHFSILHNEKLQMKRDHQRLQGHTDAADLFENRPLELGLVTTNNQIYHTPPTINTDPRRSSHPQLMVKNLVRNPLTQPTLNQRSQRQHRRPSGTN